MSRRMGEQLGNYRLGRLLGKGGFAEVYLGEHIYLKTPAAIKLLQTKVANEEDMQAFLREAQTIAQLVHPHIVRVLDFGVDGETPFLVMDYATGGTLRQRHPRGTRLPLATIVLYIKQVAEALQHAHEEKFIHRDVKPENMLVGRREAVQLSDFGIALVAQSSRYQNTQEVVGTVAYMAPEQIQGKPRPSSDQYSLGIVVYEWLCGDYPFHGSFTELCTQHMFASPAPLREKMPTVSPAVEQVVMAALNKDPKERFASVQKFATALEQASRVDQPHFSNLSQALSTSSQPPQVLTMISAATPWSQQTVASLPVEGVQTPLALSDLSRRSVSSSRLQNTSGPVRQGISRRAILLGLGGGGLVAVSSSLTWLLFSRQPRPRATPRPRVTPRAILNPLPKISPPLSPPPGITFTQAPAVVSWGPNRIDLFGLGSDGNIYHNYWDGSWHSFASLGGTFIDGVAASSWGYNRLDVFAVGTNGALYHNYWDGSWHSFASLGGMFTSFPAAVSSGPNHIDVFGRGTDNAIWHGWWDGSWHVFDSLGGVFASAPTVSSWGGGRLDVFAIGTDSALYHDYWDGNWHSWGSRLPGSFTSSPAAVSWGLNHVDVFVRSTNNRLWHALWDGTSWFVAPSLAATLTSDPAVTTWAAGRLDVFGMGTDNAIYHTTYVNGTWSG